MFHYPIARSMAVGLGLALTVSVAWADEVEEFDEANVYVEINATDGDAGLHGIFDADAWDEARIRDPGGQQILKAKAKGALAEQGSTENFFESAEPLCDESLIEEEDERVVTLAEFLDRFPAGTYVVSGDTLEGDPLESEMELTHNLPAAPTNVSLDTNGVVTWGAGSDLGECQDSAPELDPAPVGVDVVAWEIAVEPAIEIMDPILRTFSVRLKGSDNKMVQVPSEYLNSYPAATDFKVEVGAIEESGNRTFTEYVLVVGEEDEEEEDEEEE